MRKLVQALTEAASHPELCMGVDLGHPERRTTGIAIMCVRCLRTWIFTTFPVHVLSTCTYLRDRLRIVAIDAPLSLPRRGIERPLEKICRQAGYRLIPPLLGGMRRLTETGICIKEIVEKLNINVIEIHPRSSLKSMKLTKVDELLKILSVRPGNRHEVDAVLACVTALAYLKHMFIEIRDEEGNSLILPRPEIVNLLCQKRDR